MIDPEDPAAKNEQELNLFSDQPLPMGESPAEPESGESAVSGEIPVEDKTTVQDNEPAGQPVSPGTKFQRHGPPSAQVLPTTAT